MHALPHAAWHEILFPHLTWVEKIIRPILVYLILFLLFRLASKRELAQATLFDFLIVLLISNVVQNAMIGEDNSVLGAAAGAVTLILLSSIFSRATSRSRRARTVLEGQAVLLVNGGHILDRAMRKENVSRNDLLSAIRKAGTARLCEVRYAILELDGSISVIKADDDSRPLDCLPPEIVGAESAEGTNDRKRK